jgi:hypothetical protein
MPIVYSAESRSLPPSLRSRAGAEPMFVQPRRLSATGPTPAGRLRGPVSSPARAIDPRLAALLDGCD